MIYLIIPEEILVISCDNGMTSYYTDGVLQGSPVDTSHLTDLSGAVSTIGATQYYRVRRPGQTPEWSGPGADTPIAYDVLNGFVKSFNIWSKALNQEQISIYYRLGRNVNIYSVVFDVDRPL